MEFSHLITNLRNKIENQLNPLIGEKCILTDLPYYDNLGDTLIWQGELDFLKSIGKIPIAKSNYLTFDYPHVDNNTTILLQGGGNFGDLYRVLQEFRLKVISNYQNNRIIMFPQSVWYEDHSLIEKDASIMAKHKDLYLCARDKWSYDFMKEHFNSNNILLVPDMALYINPDRFRKKASPKKSILYFKRTDKELNNQTVIKQENSETHDWPVYESRNIIGIVNYYLLTLFSRPICQNMLFRNLINLYADKCMRGYYVNLAIKFLSQYQMVITTRLHALILSFLLEIPVKYIDNTTGKLSAFVDTWLKDYPYVKPYDYNSDI